MLTFAKRAAVSLILSAALAIVPLVAAAQTTTGPGTVSNDGGTRFVPPTAEIIGVDSVSGLKCYIGQTATCQLPTGARRPHTIP